MPPTIPLPRRLPAPACHFARPPPSTRRPGQSLAQQFRGFSVTPPTLYRQVRVPNSDLPIPSSNTKTDAPEIPPYPFGPRQVYKQSNTGLYGAARIRFGNNVSEKWSVKTRRKWRPNVQSRRLYSAALGVLVRTRLTTRVLRTIDKFGGLDEYLLGTKTQRLKDLGPWGWRLRWRIMQTPAVQARFARERAALGLPPKGAAEVVAAEMAQVLLPTGGATPEAVAAETQALLDEEAEFALGEEEEADKFMEEWTVEELEALKKAEAAPESSTVHEAVQEKTSDEAVPKKEETAKKGPEQFMRP